MNQKTVSRKQGCVVWHFNNSEFASLCIYKNRKNGGVLVMLCVSYLRVSVSAHGREHDEGPFGSFGAVEF